MHEFDPVMPSSDAHEDKLLRDTLLLLKQAKPKDNNKDQFMINIVSPPLSGSVDSETEKKEKEQKQMFSHDKVVSNKVTNDDNSAAKRSVERIDTEGKSLLEPDDFFDQTSTAAEDEFSLFNPQILETHATKTSVDYFIKKMEDDFLNPNTLPLNIIAMKLNTSIQELTNVIGLDVLLELQRSYEHPYQRMVKLLHIIASIELDDVSLPTVAHIFAKKAMQDLNEYNWPVFVRNTILNYIETHAQPMHVGRLPSVMQSKELQYSFHTMFDCTTAIILLSELKMHIRSPKHFMVPILEPNISSTNTFQLIPSFPVDQA